jgi:uncharacterized membrane protein YesL
MDAAFEVSELKAGRGGGWIADAFALYRQKPFAWIGLCTGWLLITLVLLQVPHIGPALEGFLQPVFFASFAIAAFRQIAGEPVLMGDLFSGFRRNVRALVQLGAFQMIAELAVAIPIWIFLMPPMPGDGGVNLSEYLESLKGREWIVFLALAALSVVKAAFWFAPPLIAFHDMSATQSIRWSIYAAIANLVPMIVYGLALVAMMLFGILTWGLAFLVVIPVMAISTFVGYREVFEAGRKPLASGDTTI